MKRVIGMQRCTLDKMKMETWIILSGMYHIRHVISVTWASKIREIENYFVTAMPSRVEVLSCMTCFVCLFVLQGGPNQSLDRDASSFVQRATGKASKIIPMPAVIKMFLILAGSFLRDAHIIFRYLEKK